MLSFSKHLANNTVIIIPRIGVIVSKIHKDMALRIKILALLLSVAGAVLAQEPPYSSEVEQRAIKMAYEIIKVYFPNDDICVDPNIYNAPTGMAYIEEPTDKDL